MKKSPEGIILEVFDDIITFKGKNILEIGCGDGRLTFKFSGLAKRVIAIDPDRKDVERALHTSSQPLSSKLDFQVATGEFLPFVPYAFDIIFYTGSLCCMNSEQIVEEALYEAWRVLKVDGVLLNLQPARHQFSLDVLREFYQKGDYFHLIAEKSKTVTNCWWRYSTDQIVFSILRKRVK
ncbi:MAG: class I SAM-dependent methyltransferase [Candidatus Thorarchaeota archaeon]